MKIAVCDDEIRAREQMKEYIENYNCGLDFEIEEFSSGEDLIFKLRQEHIDIIFLDIEMDKIDGIDTAKLIRINDKKAIIIFVSSHKERVFDSFDCEAFNFITKPFTKEKFNDVFTKAIEKYKFLNESLTISWRGTTVELPIEKIKYFESYKKHIIFHTYDGEFQMVANLSDKLKELSSYGFLQIHQGYVVNMNLISRFDGLDIILVDGTKVPMSLRKKSTVLSEYAKYVARYKI